MRLLLQNTRDKRYYQGEGQWTQDPHLAFDFQYSAGRRDYANELASMDAQLVIHIGTAPQTPMLPPQPLA